MEIKGDNRVQVRKHFLKRKTFLFFFSDGRSTRSNFYLLFDKGEVTIAKKVPGENRSLDP